MKYKVLIGLLLIIGMNIFQKEENISQQKEVTIPQCVSSYKSPTYKRPEKISPPIQKKETGIVIPVTHDLFKDAPNQIEKK